ncbi:MAG: LytTR family DNA-binding domain-containing protein [Balneolaceae bacterium]
MSDPQDNRKIDCLIIDDDPFIHNLLQDKLSQHFPEITILGIAHSGEDGIKKISTLNPELIFLDVEMSDMTGFEMLSRVHSINFRTIFITSYSHYAIKAIRFNALDYLLKPFDLEELKESIKRFKFLRGRDNNSSLKLAVKNVHIPDIGEHYFILQTQNGELKFQIKDIIRIEGDRNYSILYLRNGKKELVSKTLSTLEEMLNGKGFYRTHKSHIINRLHILGLEHSGNLLLQNGERLPVSRRKKREFQRWFNS